ncbi:DMT family transporter [Desertibaculum subflavum]|uniref:DMT family transporter n=1 Tax=Desertibaculum subflavum TaxID=2268458 RepID=UPI0013C4CCED
MNKLLLANFAAAAAALSAGASVVATRIAVGEIDPVTLSLMRYVIAGACLAPVLYLTWPKERLPPAEVAKIAALGALFFAFFPWAFSAALQYTTTPRGAVGLATIPIQTLIIAAMFGRELLTRWKIASVALAFAGIAIVFGPAAEAGAGPDMLLGDGLMLLGACSAAIYSVFGRGVLGRHGALFVTALGMLFGVVALLPLSLANGGPDALPTFSREAWLAILFLGTFGGAIQFSLFMWALRWLAPTRTVIYLTLNPLTAMLLGGLMLGEAVTLALAAGLACVIAGILVANLPRERRELAPAATVVRESA